ncbi:MULTISPECIES: pyruvate ferredoxin oxidoreductase [Tepidanaerobacter]|uniref:Pyruvate ferredoxin oxidoreductase alpha subunit n=1 Tax=Tepidanaerobacter syntrophicus TaxID=224999 RepID=A0A0U9HGF4_9FIRM|nr:MULTISPECIES: pyruvate ferredoxin oxidoreductase [Tepidanaerobacter]GAQ25590.1 pyruvate ferredoxin oxidoreductase alpha subunit [Tepidanaerobacter syntrophicus]GLI19957.1 2-ketoisovalerate ferredoxin oxidoreductase subunit alpha [Tepidanaerobacter syntrophicus]GLI51586.1 2-ketoisovalerate ferredoxin oxidoreductase subunit alpha [Tepidanaerobacter syntrophicus]
MENKVALTGNEAVAEAMRQINPDVVAAYPITPSTEVVQMFSSFVANGKVDSDFVTVESEHSAMSATMGASAAGARAMTCTSSQGLAYMFEVVYIAASMRLPIVFAVANRTLSAPINIHCDHSDAMGIKQSGVIQLFSENAQEAYDNMIQAVRIAEHPDVHLPVSVNYDGFITSHALDILEILDDETVKNFVGVYKPEEYLLNVKEPISMGNFDMYDYYFEHKYQQVAAMEAAKRVIEEIGKEYEKISGRKYGLIDAYKLDDADMAVVVMNSAAGSAKGVCDELRAKGMKVGVLKPRAFRPFPHEAIADALKGVKAVAVLDRAETFSTLGGPMFGDVRNSLYDLKNDIKVVNYVYGLGGRDLRLEDVEKVYNDLADIIKTGKADNFVRYLGLRE